MKSVLANVLTIVFCIFLIFDSILKSNRVTRRVMLARILFGLSTILWTLAGVVIYTSKFRVKLSPNSLNLIGDLWFVLGGLAVGISVTLIILGHIGFWRNNDTEPNKQG